jgi:hypothetical protein
LTLMSGMSVFLPVGLGDGISPGLGSADRRLVDRSSALLDGSCAGSRR